MKQFVFVTWLTTSLCFAQTRTVYNQTHAWGVYTGTYKLYKKANLYTEYQFRRSDWGKNWQQSLSRVGLEIKFNPTWQATIGYGFIMTYPYGDIPYPYSFNEHRIWEQVNVVQEVKKLKFQHRYRLEQRWVETKLFDQTREQYVFHTFIYVNRMRYRCMLTYPLVELSNNHKLGLMVSDEVFIAFGKNVAFNVLDQNRIYGGLTWSLPKALTFSIGYLNQFLLKSSGTKAENNHTLQIGITVQI